MEASLSLSASTKDETLSIALGVSGGIASYKSAEILRRLQDKGFDVFVLMTQNARKFVTPLTFEALSGNPVLSDLFEGPSGSLEAQDPFEHIFLAQKIDLFLVAPATANCIARMAAGVADDFLTTFHLAVQAPIVIAPAMNTRMWEHEAVQANITTLRDRGVHVIDPEFGQMACNTTGPGRLAEIDRIVDCVVSFSMHQNDLAGKKLLVTAGPTLEDIDPVRFIGNRSSGKMGFAIAEAARARGGDVTLIAGPTELDFPGAIRVRSTEQMYAAVVEHFADVIVKAAAPLDFRPKNVSDEKIKKESGLSITFEPTPDILSELSNKKNGKVFVGFAAETENHVENGLGKLKAKNLDLIVVNSVSGPNSAFDGDSNQGSIVNPDGEREDLPRMSKLEMADRIIDRVVALL